VNKAYRCLFVITGAEVTHGGIATVNRLVSTALYDFGYTTETYSLGEAVFLGKSQRYHCFGGNKFKFSWSIWLELLSKKFDLVIVDHVNLASILAPLKILRKCKYYVWLHGIEVYPPNPDLTGYLGMVGARRCLANSAYTRDKVIARYPNLDIVTCELCLEPSKICSSWPLPLDQNTTEISFHSVDGIVRKINNQMILHVGRMVSGHRDKGQRVLLEAFPIIVERFPEAQLMLVGQGEEFPRLFEMARELSPALQKQIFLPGFLPDDLLDGVYQSCYLFAMPSTGEGFGLVYLEAMAHAKPCLGANIDATPGLIHDDVTGVLVQNPHSRQEVAEKIIILLADPAKAKQLGLGGYDLLNSKYLFSHFKERFARALDLS
jgi:phosphatidyl-myo-inositol dimannoside synthase